MVVIEPVIFLLALLDSMNVCSFTLFLLFISLMFLYNASRRVIIFLGMAYIVGMYISYFMTGLGIVLLAINFPVVPHFLSRIGAGLMLFFGIANVLNYFMPGVIPTMSWSGIGKKVVSYMKVLGSGVSGFMAVFVGMLAGLHNFPCACTGGIYFTFLGFISDSPLFFAYLIIYNLIFVIPFIIILLVCTSKLVVLKLRTWHENNKARTRFIIGTIMIIASLTVLSLIITGLV